jgi:hypothetical protein
MTNRADDKLYVQEVLREKSAELWQRGGAHMYFCGINGILEVAAERGVDWATKLNEFKAVHNGWWHVEAYQEFRSFWTPKWIWQRLPPFRSMRRQSIHRAPRIRSLAAQPFVVDQHPVYERFLG